MKRFLLFTLLLILPFSILKGTTYAVTDSISVSSTGVDSTFSQRWVGCSFWFLGCEGQVKYATSPNDTTSWSSKQWTVLSDGQVMQFWPLFPEFPSSLYRLEYRCTTGTGALFISGLKNRNR